MNLHYNSTDPEHIKERQNVVPSTVEEMESLMALFNNLWSENLIGFKTPLLQRLIYDYENKSHFHEEVGGWEGLEKKINESYEIGVNNAKYRE